MNRWGATIDCEYWRCSASSVWLGLAQGLQKAARVVLVGEDPFPPVAPVHEMIDGAGILQAKFARHAGEGVQHLQSVSIVMTDPF
jgi:hypothetical protein